MSNQRWDGASYDRVSNIQQEWAAAIIARLELEGSETVLDAGCGSGRVTEQLLEALPRGRVIAVDASPSMVEAARERLLGDPANEGRVAVELVDLVDLDLDEPVDAVFSSATFHWIRDHERLFARMHAALRPGGRLVAQCGGEGNIAGLRGRVARVMAREPYAGHFAGWEPPWNYAGAQESERLLTAAGFDRVRCWLAEAPSVPNEPREFLSTIVFGPHNQRLPQELREPFMDDVMATLGDDVTIDYVRLNIDAVA
ncbi:MAG TPA: class I SAM-dependent methyltransferase [Solirubrobacteraceae bacterium]|jgi:trans-aconitate 2-methyltransferase|nr:class I SAM-dependent methyltransferase [Solirubrobacteraceae bacterium]